MIRLPAMLLIACLATLPAAAQGAPPAAAPASPAPVVTMPSPTAPAATPTPSLTKNGLPRMKDVRAQCRDEVTGQGLKGDARRDAMGACVVKARPDKAAQVKCQMDPQAKGLAKDARRAFVKDCVAKAKG